MRGRKSLSRQAGNRKDVCSVKKDDDNDERESKGGKAFQSKPNIQLAHAQALHEKTSLLTWISVEREADEYSAPSPLPFWAFLSPLPKFL
eukprot:c16951_g2_i1 orf=1-267(-)